MKPTIKFSQNYEKLPHIFTNVVLLEVLKVKLEDLSPAFLKYDTLYIENEKEKYYSLPSKGDYLLLLFHQPKTNQVFTTIRRHTSEKYTYYRNNIGKEFDIEIVKETSQAQQESTQRNPNHEHKIQSFYKWLDSQNFTPSTKETLHKTKLEIVNGRLVAHTTNQLYLKIIEQYLKIQGLSLEITNNR